MTTLSVKLDDQDKVNFERIVNSMGLNLTSAVTAFVKATIYTNGMPFELKAQEEYYPEALSDQILQQHIEMEKQRKNGTLKTYNNADELFSDL